MRPATLGGLVVIGAASVAAYRAGLVPAAVGDVASEAADYLGEEVGKIAETVQSFFSWAPPKLYAGVIANTEAANGIPTNMLARLIWTESRYRADAVSPAGAQGIAQFMPATARELGIDPFDPFQAIPAAGRYLASLYRQTGSWAEALAAYNWGIGNVKRRGLSAAPAETRNYYSGILSALGMA